jgi:dTDP-4-dehydrorhamnose reductase
MKILVTGSKGMLGAALLSAFSRDVSYKVTGLDSDKKRDPGKAKAAFKFCDIADSGRLTGIIDEVKPDIIVHAAAYTDVDGCELHPDKAETINGVATRYVAEAAAEANAGLIYISTDFVFDGKKRSPYTEDDVPAPLNVYGRSKLDGERFAADALKSGKLVIIRTSWLFGLGGRNFIDTVLKKAAEEKELKIVSDQFGSPTYAADLADGIVGMINSIRDKKTDVKGIYHMTNSDNCSWYRLAQKALGLSSMHDVDLVPIVSLELDRPAERPAMSILDNTRYIKLSGRPLRRWEKALEEYLKVRGR